MWQEVGIGGGANDLTEEGGGGGGEGVLNLTGRDNLLKILSFVPLFLQAKIVWGKCLI